jgi:hypothetical protein
MRPLRCRCSSLAASLVCLIGCLGDTVGLGGTLILKRLSPPDSILMGAPGRPLATPITFQAVDGEGHPVSGADVSWTAIGSKSRVAHAMATTDARGQVSAKWVLGTVASEEQALAVRVRVAEHVASDTVEATARPIEVGSISLGDGDTIAIKLGVTTNLTVRVTDPFGNSFVPVGIQFAAMDSTYCTVDSLGVVLARKRGFGRVVVSASSVSDTVVVHVIQVAQAIVTSPDTVTFHALGQTASLDVTLLDDQGRYILDSTPPVTNFVVADTLVAEHLDSMMLRAHGDGVTSASFNMAGLAGYVTILVDQVPATLTAAVGFAASVVTLPVGATLPLTCRAFDENGFPVPRDPTLVGSAHGTITGDRCSDARVQRSGYDTLLLALGSVQTHLPVIVATAPDSIGILTMAQPLSTVDRTLFVGENLTSPSIQALHPLVSDILAAYGNPKTNLDRARAIRDWVARTAIHPYPPLHPTGSTSNLSVLPPDMTWADVNPVSMAKVDDDAQYWGAVGMNGYAMLDRLLGTLDPNTGLRANDGMMVHMQGARYRIRDVASYRYILCSYEDVIVNALWAAAGLQGMLISTIGHDPAAVFIPELGRWVYEDPEWDEEYLLDGTGEPLSPSALLTLSSAGEGGRLQASKLQGPSFAPEVYVSGDSYMNEGHSDGFAIMGSQLYNSVVETVVPGSGSWPVRYVQIDGPQLAVAPPPFNDPILYARVTSQDAFPTLGVVVQELQSEDSVYVARLSSTFPNHQAFERRMGSGPWQTVGDIDVLPVGACRVEYRSVDADGNVSASAVLDVWAPRPEEFIELDGASGVRSQTTLCVDQSR